MREFFINYIQKILLENSKYNLSQIIYDTGLWQIFNSNIFNDNFKNIEYVLPIMKNMDLDVFHSFETNFIGQLKRVVKNIKGKILYENLILLDEFKVPKILNASLHSFIWNFPLDPSLWFLYAFSWEYDHLVHLLYKLTGDDLRKIHYKQRSDDY
jgi:hypothetical protein